MRVRIKICCISSYAEAQTAIRLGADALGLVGQMPSGPGIIGDALAGQIARQIPPPIATFLLTAETTANGIIAHHRRVNSSVLQLVDAVPAGTYPAIKAALPAVKIVQVIHITGDESLDEALRAVADGADALLLDSGNPALAVRELGGTGRVHNWAVSRQIVTQSRVPVFLAGGLNPQNARAAIETVQPFGVDICSGVRTNGQLDEAKLAEIMKTIEHESMERR